MLNSIRVRLALLFTGILALILIAFAIAASLFQNYIVSRQTDRILREISHSFVEMIEVEHDELTLERHESSDVNKAVVEAVEGLHYRNYQIFIFDSDNKLVSPEDIRRDKKTLRVDQLTGVIDEFRSSSKEAMFFDLSANENRFRLLAANNRIADRNYSIVVAHSLDEESELNGIFLLTLGISIPLALILACAGGYFLARKALSPVVLMSNSASQISATNLHERLPIKNEKDELGSLAKTLNSLLERLEASFENQKRLWRMLRTSCVLR